MARVLPTNSQSKARASTIFIYLAGTKEFSAKVPSPCSPSVAHPHSSGVSMNDTTIWEVLIL